MKTSVLNQNVLTKYLFAVIAIIVPNLIFAQSGPGGGSGNNSPLSNGLSFQSYTRISGINNQAGSVYLYEDVAPGIDATVKIDSLVNGAAINIFDDNSNNVGYRQAFQPAIRSGNVVGYSYAVFSFKFFVANTNQPLLLETVNATALDIDGNSTLKEFAEINMGGGNATFMSTTVDISLLQPLTGKFIGENILGIERNGIDTTAFANMFTVTNGGINGFTLRAGTFTVSPTNTSRQFSLYMKAFQYPFQGTLPVELFSFTATLNKKQVELKWITLTEMNVSHFIVEKSVDGKNFSDAGVVFAFGNTTEKKTYSLIDNVTNIQNGMVYYRLRTYDIDGRSQLSETRIIRIGKEMQGISLLTYPNPVINELRITLPKEWQNRKVHIQIFNSKGQMVRSHVTLSASQTEMINVSSLTRGVYGVKASDGEYTAQQTIVKQ